MGFIFLGIVRVTMQSFSFSRSSDFFFVCFSSYLSFRFKYLRNRFGSERLLMLLMMLMLILPSTPGTTRIGTVVVWGETRSVRGV